MSKIRPSLDGTKIRRLLAEPIRQKSAENRGKRAGTKAYVRNYKLIMQNKPNFRKSQMNLKFCKQMDYENKWQRKVRKNKPNSNPNKPNCFKAKMNVNSLITKDYRKNDDFAVRINKPNFRNAQNKRKLTYNKGLQKKRCFSVQKNKPKQSQFKPNQRQISYIPGLNHLKKHGQASYQDFSLLPWSCSMAKATGEGTSWPCRCPDSTSSIASCRAMHACS